MPSLEGLFWAPISDGLVSARAPAPVSFVPTVGLAADVLQLHVCAVPSIHRRRKCV